MDLVIWCYPVFDINYTTKTSENYTHGIEARNNVVTSEMEQIGIPGINLAVSFVSFSCMQFAAIQ
jgi:hypothetical protein